MFPTTPPVKDGIRYPRSALSLAHALTRVKRQGRRPNKVVEPTALPSNKRAHLERTRQTKGMMSPKL
jgi:hypothetical protein